MGVSPNRKQRLQGRWHPPGSLPRFPNQLPGTSELHKEPRANSRTRLCARAQKSADTRRGYGMLRPRGSCTWVASRAVAERDPSAASKGSRGGMGSSKSLARKHACEGWGSARLGGSGWRGRRSWLGGGRNRRAPEWGGRGGRWGGSGLRALRSSALAPASRALQLPPACAAAAAAGEATSREPATGRTPAPRPSSAKRPKAMDTLAWLLTLLVLLCAQQHRGTR